MLETILEKETLEEVLEEEEKKMKLGIKKLALMHDNTILKLFNTNTDVEVIENDAIDIVKNTLQLDNIDLCYIVIDEKYYNIKYKNIIQSNIMVDYLENYQKINNHIYILDNKELKLELLKYSKYIFNNILDNNDLYFEVTSDISLYNNCISWIYDEIINSYNNGYTIYTSENSLIQYSSYIDIKTAVDGSHYILNKDTKLFIIDEIQQSDLLEDTQNKIIKNIKNY